MTKDTHASPGSGYLKQQPNGRWKAQIQIAGKRHTARFPTKSQAQQWMRKLQSEADAGKPPIVPSKTKMAEYLSEWLEGKRQAIERKTWQTYECHLRVHIVPHIGGVPLRQLDASHLESLYAALSSHPRTAAACHRILSQALKHAVRRRLIESNPAELALAPRYQSPPRTTWTAQQAQRFLSSLTDEPWRLAYWLLLTTGMRVGELCGLRWEDVDLARKCLTIRRSLQRLRAGSGGLVVGSTKTDRQRLIVLIDDVVSQLRASAGPAGEYVIGQEGLPCEPHQVERDLERRLKALQLPRITPHAMRHTCATLLLERGVPVKAVSEILGHSRINITLDLYGHITTAMQETAVATQAEIYRTGCTEDAPGTRLRVVK